MSREFKRKVVLVGDPGVGKTSLINRFVKNEYSDQYIQTIGAKVAKKELTLAVHRQEVHVVLSIWDVVGAQGYRGVQARSFAGAQGALVVCDSTDGETLESVGRYWMPLLQQAAQRVPCVFLANKDDLEPEITLEELMAAALKHGDAGGPLPKGFVTYYFTSAKTGDNVQKAFATLGHLLCTEPVVSDEIKRAVDTLMAMGLSQKVDTSTPKGVADALMIDVLNGFPDTESAFAIIRAEFVRAGVEVAGPTKEQLARAVDCLADGERVFLGETVVEENRSRRQKLVETLS